MAGSNNGQVFTGSALDVATAVVEGNLTVGGTQVFGGNQSVAGSLAVTGAASVAGTTTLGSGVFGGTAVGLPTVTNINAGLTSVTLSAGSTDFRGIITCVTTATPPTANQRWFTLNFFNTTRFATAPVVLLINASQGAPTTTATPIVFGQAAATATAVDVVQNNQASASSINTLLIHYIVIGMT